MTTDDIVVRAVGREGATTLARIEAAAFDVPWTAGELEAMLDDGLTCAWVASRGAVPLGGALVRVVAGEGEILRIAVAPASRRQGIGGRLLRTLMSAIADACMEGVYLEVRASNAAARGLYARAGFVECGRRRDYYAAPCEDAVLMRWRPSTMGRAHV